MYHSVTSTVFVCMCSLHRTLACGGSAAFLGTYDCHFVSKFRTGMSHGRGQCFIHRRSKR